MGKKGNVLVKDSTKRNRFFENLCMFPQKKLKQFLVRELKDMGKEVIVGDGYIFSEGKFPVLLCAHLDTVHKSLPKTIIYEEGKITSPEGIGGDDRCGVYMILQILKRIDCYVAFFEDEEIGGIGSHKFAKTEICKKIDVNYVIELDRMNANDAVFYECDNEEFEDFVTREFFKTNWGSFTDICEICPQIGVAGVNLSCGYYKQHTSNEYVVLDEMETAIEEVIKLLNRTEPETVFEYIEAIHYWSSYYKGYVGSTSTSEKKMWDKWSLEWEVCFYYDGEEIIDYAYGSTEAEAYYDFAQAYPDVPYGKVLYIARI